MRRGQPSDNSTFDADQSSTFGYKQIVNGQFANFRRCADSHADSNMAANSNRAGSLTRNWPNIGETRRGISRRDLS